MAGETPGVSVIVATYNSARTLRWALCSIQAQQFQDFEALVVGDCCNDDSPEVVSGMADPRFRWINLDHNSGAQAAPNNEGLRQARGGLIAYLGHDDLWFPHHLEQLVRAQRETGADFVHPLIATFNRAGLDTVIGTPVADGGHMWHAPSPSSWLHTRALAVRIGPWNKPDALPCGTDMDFYRRVILSGARVHMVERLSTLKFPSPRFKLYDTSTPHPQADYWRQMRDDPRQLEHTLLNQCARKLAKLHYGDPSMAELARFVARRMLRKGRRWMLSAPLLARVETWRFQWWRRRLRAKRGLGNR